MDFSEIVVGPYRVLAAPDKLPSLHADYRERAVLAEDFDLANNAEGICFFAVGLHRDAWPELVVSQGHEPAGHGFNPVLMAAELELAAWSIEGEKLWTTFVEPPWTYSISDEQVRLDVMGTISTFPLRQGPTRETRA